MKIVVTDKLIKILENKILKYIISISKNVYIDTLNDLVNE